MSGRDPAEATAAAMAAAAAPRPRRDGTMTPGGSYANATAPKAPMVPGPAPSAEPKLPPPAPRSPAEDDAISILYGSPVRSGGR